MFQKADGTLPLSIIFLMSFFVLSYFIHTFRYLQCFDQNILRINFLLPRGFRIFPFDFCAQCQEETTTIIYLVVKIDPFFNKYLYFSTFILSMLRLKNSISHSRKKDYINENILSEHCRQVADTFSQKLDEFNFSFQSLHKLEGSEF